MKLALSLATLIATSAATLAAMADMSADVGKWNVKFREGDAALQLENRALRLSVDGKLAFSSEAFDRAVPQGRREFLSGAADFRRHGDGARRVVRLPHDP